jgi:hypothetical protein
MFPHSVLSGLPAMLILVISSWACSQSRTLIEDVILLPPNIVPGRAGVIDPVRRCQMNVWFQCAGAKSFWRPLPVDLVCCRMISDVVNCVSTIAISYHGGDGLHDDLACGYISLTFDRLKILKIFALYERTLLSTTTSVGMRPCQGTLSR